MLRVLPHQGLLLRTRKSSVRIPVWKAYARRSPVHWMLSASVTVLEAQKTVALLSGSVDFIEPLRHQCKLFFHHILVGWSWRPVRVPPQAAPSATQELDATGGSAAQPLFSFQTARWPCFPMSWT